VSVDPGRGRTDTHERLRRLLLLVPYVARNPGQSVQAVADAMGVSRERLLEELDLLTLVGRPPFQPDDFIDIYVDDDQVFVSLDQRFSRPPRLTAAEGVALAAAAALLKPAANSALARALEKLARVLPEQAQESFAQRSRQLDVAVAGPDAVGGLTNAIVERREVELEYFTASRGQTERRRVRPLELFSRDGQWYLQAWCLTRQDERLFRVDRIASWSVTEARFAPQAQASKTPSPESARVLARVRFSARTAPYVRERFGPEVVERGEGEVEVQVPAESTRWLTRWVLSFGGEARVVEPRSAVEAVAEAARQALR
jgi:proteasome accessory factor C